MKVLSINAGSSTLKYRLFEMPEAKVLMKGAIERIGLPGSNLVISVGDKKIKKEYEIKNHAEAVKHLLEELLNEGIVSSLDEIEAVGHRIVHGGSFYSNSVVLNEEVLSKIESINDLAPLHNPANVIGVRAFMEAIPNALEVGCFDTAFHQTMDEEEFLYSIPYELYEKYGIRKYGFHGMSHKYITLKMEEILGKDSVNLIICHIGNGASVTAVKDSKSIDTSMGFTPNAGVMMGSRSGVIDYSLIPYLMKKANLSLEEVDNILNKKSGLEGLTGMSDLRDLDEGFANNDKVIIRGINMYTKRIAEYIAKYYIELDGNVDAICFTAGVGENDSMIRSEVIKRVNALGIKLDEKVNEKTVTRKGLEGVISSKDSKVKVYVLATDEEQMIARDTYDLAK